MSSPRYPIAASNVVRASIVIIFSICSSDLDCCPPLTVRTAGRDPCPQRLGGPSLGPPELDGGRDLPRAVEPPPRPEAETTRGRGLHCRQHQPGRGVAQ